MLRAALSLRRGPALADFRYEPFAQAEIARLEELRLVCLEERIEADLALGASGERVGELQRLRSARRGDGIAPVRPQLLPAQRPAARMPQAVDTVTSDPGLRCIIRVEEAKRLASTRAGPPKPTAQGVRARRDPQHGAQRARVARRDGGQVEQVRDDPSGTRLSSSLNDHAREAAG